MRLDKKRLLVCLAIACLIAFSIFNLSIILRMLTWPYSFEYDEAAIYATNFTYLYKSMATYPYLISYYPPMFYLLSEGLNSVVHIQPYFAERALNLLALIADSILIYLVTKRIIGKRTTVTIIAPLLFLSSYFTLLFGVSAGPIILELLFDLIAIYLVIDYKDNRRLVCSSTFLTFSLLSRQTAVFIFFAIALYLFINKKRKDALLFTGSYLLMAIPVLLLIDLATGGRFFLSVFILLSMAPFSSVSITHLLEAFLQESWTLPLLIFALYWTEKNKKSLMTICTAVSVLYVISAAKASANIYYFLVFFAFLCITSTAGIEAMLARKQAKYTFPIVYLLITLVFIGISMPVAYLSSPYLPYFKSSVNTEVGIYLRNITGNILVEDPAVAIAANKAVVFEPSMFWVLQNEHLWNDTEIVSSIQAKKFGAIAMPNCIGRLKYYPEILNATAAYYHLNKMVDYWYIYIPDTNTSSAKTGSTVINACLKNNATG
jgi:hypothetical protein